MRHATRGLSAGIASTDKLGNSVLQGDPDGLTPKKVELTFFRCDDDFFLLRDTLTAVALQTAWLSHF